MLRQLWLEDESGVVDELPEVLKRLEDMLRLRCRRAFDLAVYELLRLRVREIVVELLLQGR
jgi:hypothetical protein